MDLAHKLCEFSQIAIKAADNGPGSLQGYGSTFSNWDRMNERPVKGAFLPHLAEFKRDGYIHADHAWSFPLALATITDAFEDDHGLFLEADFHTTADAQKARTIAAERIERGKSVSLSIGYQVLKSTFVEDESLPGGTGRLLQEIKLHEVSLVVVPANSLALLTGAKDWLPAGLPLDAHHDQALAAVRGYVKRLEELHELRAKEGRVLSSANREKLASARGGLRDLLALIDDLLAGSEPKSIPDPLHAELMRFLAIQQDAIINGVSL